MAQILFKGNPIHTNGNLPAIQSQAPDFVLVDHDLMDRSLSSFKGKKKLIATVPSLDTGVCSAMTKELNQFAIMHPDVAVLIVSTDLPFAQKRFCIAENVHNVCTLSMMRNKEFGKTYGVLILDGPLAGILARSITVLDEKDHVAYTELVSEITTEPDYQKALEALSRKNH
jgi:thioredoxin-dependent peroxiredoxin